MKREGRRITAMDLPFAGGSVVTRDHAQLSVCRSGLREEKEENQPYRERLSKARTGKTHLRCRSDLLVLLGRGPTQHRCRSEEWRVEAGLYSGARARPRRLPWRLWQEPIDECERVRRRAGEKPAETSGDRC